MYRKVNVGEVASLIDLLLKNGHRVEINIHRLHTKIQVNAFDMLEYPGASYAFAVRDSSLDCKGIGKEAQQLFQLLDGYGKGTSSYGILESGVHDEVYDFRGDILVCLKCGAESKKGKREAGISGKCVDFFRRTDTSVDAFEVDQYVEQANNEGSRLNFLDGVRLLMQQKKNTKR